MKKKIKNISNPDELNKYLQHTSPLTWLVLMLSIVALAGVFVWSYIYKLKIKLVGDATIKSGEVSLTIDDADLGKLSVGQTVYILEEEGKILSFTEEGVPVLTHFDLADGDYEYTVLYEKRPIDFLIGK